MQIVTHEMVDTRTGTNQLLSNIAAWTKIAEILATTLGPYGRDKLFVRGSDIILTNDGATILKNLSVDHPAAKFLLKISESQDKNMGDGTTSVVLLAVEMLNRLRPLIIEKYPLADMAACVEQLRDVVSDELELMKTEILDDALLKVAHTSLNSKILATQGEMFAKIVVEGVKNIRTLADLGIKKVRGGSLAESVLVDGVAFEKCFTYAGYEQQPKMIKNPKVLCLNVELEWKSERENAEVRVGVGDYQSMVDAEWALIRGRLERIVSSGANVVFSCQPIGDYATQFFAKHGIFCAGRVPRGDLERVVLSCGGTIYTSLANLADLGRSTLFEERQVGGTRYNFLQAGKSCTILLRGPGTEILGEAERSINDAVNVVYQALKHPYQVLGAGCTEMAISNKLRDLGRSVGGRNAMVYMAVAQAFETIPFNLARNFGLDPLAVLQQLRHRHGIGEKYGVTFDGVGEISDVTEPLVVKKSLYQMAFNAVITLVNVDCTFVSEKRNLE